MLLLLVQSIISNFKCVAVIDCELWAIKSWKIAKKIHFCPSYLTLGGYSDPSWGVTEGNFFSRQSNTYILIWYEENVCCFSSYETQFLATSWCYCSWPIWLKVPQFFKWSKIQKCSFRVVYPCTKRAQSLLLLIFEWENNNEWLIDKIYSISGTYCMQLTSKINCHRIISLESPNLMILSNWVAGELENSDIWETRA